MLLSNLAEELQALRGKNSNAISKSDIELALKKMKALGNGFEIIKIGSQKLVQSIPYELSTDHMAAMSLAQSHGGFITASILQKEGWSADRIQVATVRSNSWLEVRGELTQGKDQLLSDGLVWVDEQTDAEPEYWFPSLLEIPGESEFQS